MGAWGITPDSFWALAHVLGGGAVTTRKSSRTGRKLFRAHCGLFSIHLPDVQSIPLTETKLLQTRDVLKLEMLPLLQVHGNSDQPIPLETVQALLTMEDGHVIQQ